jgi:hypothetical protein
MVWDGGIIKLVTFGLTCASMDCIYNRAIRPEESIWWAISQKELGIDCQLTAVSHDSKPRQTLL